MILRTRRHLAAIEVCSPVKLVLEVEMEHVKQKQNKRLSQEYQLYIPENY